MRPPRFSQYGIYHHPFAVDPDHGQVKKNEEHMNGTVEAIIFGVNQNQTIGGGQVATKGEATQFAEEGVTPLRLGDQDAAAGRQDNLFSCGHSREV